MIFILNLSGIMHGIVASARVLVPVLLVAGFALMIIGLWNEGHYIVTAAMLILPVIVPCLFGAKRVKSGLAVLLFLLVPVYVYGYSVSAYYGEGGSPFAAEKTDQGRQLEDFITGRDLTQLESYPLWPDAVKAWANTRERDTRAYWTLQDKNGNWVGYEADCAQGGFFLTRAKGCRDWDTVRTDYGVNMARAMANHDTPITIANDAVKGDPLDGIQVGDVRALYGNGMDIMGTGITAIYPQGFNDWKRDIYRQDRQPTQDEYKLAAMKYGDWAGFYYECLVTRSGPREKCGSWDRIHNSYGIDVPVLMGALLARTGKTCAQLMYCQYLTEAARLDYP